MQLLDLNFDLLLTSIVRLSLAFIIALPVALEREQSTRIMGIRTYPLVAMGSCAYFLVAQRVFGPNSDPMARVFQGLLQGIGFLGTAAIIKQQIDDEPTHVRGTATAASIWITGVIGASAAYGFYEIAIVMSLFTFVTLRYLIRFKKVVSQDKE